MSRLVSAIRLCNTDRIQRSSSGRSAGGGAAARSSIVMPSASAYVVKKENAFHSGSSTVRTTSRTPSSLKRRGSARSTGELIMNARNASAPKRLSSSSGSG